VREAHNQALFSQLERTSSKYEILQRNAQGSFKMSRLYVTLHNIDYGAASSADAVLMLVALESKRFKVGETLSSCDNENNRNDFAAG